MLEYSQGFWYRHHPKPSRFSWWSLVDTYKWRIMVGVCFVGLLSYWGISSIFSSEKVSVNSVPVASPLTISDPWTRADGEVGAFTPVAIEPVRFSSGGFAFTPSRDSANMPFAPTVEPVNEAEKSVLFFEEPDFVCEYLSHPNAFHYCVAIGESAFLRQQQSSPVNKPLSIDLLLSIFASGR